MPGRKNTDDQVAQRRAEVAELYLEGMTQAEIADRYDLDRSQIAKDLKAIRQQWLESRLANYNDLVNRELAIIEGIELKAMDAWERSCEDAEIVKTRKEGRRNAYSETTVKGQAGDSQFLRVILDCCKRRCDLLGLDAPKKIAQTDKEGNDIPADQRRASLIEALNAARDN